MDASVRRTADGPGRGGPMPVSGTERSVPLAEAARRVTATLVALGLEAHLTELGNGTEPTAWRCELRTPGGDVAPEVQGAGKGTREEARVGALFEALEHHLTGPAHFEPAAVEHVPAAAVVQHLAGDVIAPLLQEAMSAPLACHRYRRLHTGGPAPAPAERRGPLDRAGVLAVPLVHRRTRLASPHRRRLRLRPGGPLLLQQRLRDRGQRRRGGRARPERSHRTRRLLPAAGPHLPRRPPAARERPGHPARRSCPRTGGGRPARRPAGPPARRHRRDAAGDRHRARADDGSLSSTSAAGRCTGSGRAMRAGGTGAATSPENRVTAGTDAAAAARLCPMHHGAERCAAVHGSVRGRWCWSSGRPTWQRSR